VVRSRIAGFVVLKSKLPAPRDAPVAYPWSRSVVSV